MGSAPSLPRTVHCPTIGTGGSIPLTGPELGLGIARILREGAHEVGEEIGDPVRENVGERAAVGGHGSVTAV